MDRGRRSSWQKKGVETLGERGRRELDERSGGREEEGDRGLGEAWRTKEVNEWR